jgi:hypothetical protein
MSLSLRIEDRPCPHCGRADATYSWNYTYNVSPMLTAAARDAGLTEAEYGGHMLAGIEGRAGDYVPKLRRLIEALRASPEKFRAANPSNGWGDYDRFVERLGDLLAHMESHPDADVRSFR